MKTGCPLEKNWRPPGARFFWWEPSFYFREPRGGQNEQILLQNMPGARRFTLKTIENRVLQAHSGLDLVHLGPSGRPVSSNKNCGAL